MNREFILDDIKSIVGNINDNVRKMSFDQYTEFVSDYPNWDVDMEEEVKMLTEYVENGEYDDITGKEEIKDARCCIFEVLWEIEEKAEYWVSQEMPKYASKWEYDERTLCL